MDKRIREYLRQLAKKGGKAQKQEYSRATLSKWGRLRGRPPGKKKEGEE